MKRAATTSTAETNVTMPSLEQISRRAYDIWASEGRPAGCEMEHWLRAERELNTAREPASPSQPRTSRRGTGNGSSVSKNAEWCPW